MRARIVFNGVVTLLALAVVLSASAADKPENLVQNNDFEDRGVQPWTMWIEDAAAGVAANMVPDNDEAVKGRQSLLIDIKNGGKANKRIELHQRHFILEKGMELTYAMWAKAEDVREAKMIVNHRQAPWTSYGAKNITIQQEWQEFWTPVNMTADDNLVGIYVELRDSIEGKVWFDNFRFYEGDYEPDEELGQENLSVEAKGKLTTAWGRLKAQN